MRSEMGFTVASEVEKLRALLVEAREFVALFHEAGCPADQCEGCAASTDMMQRIDAALAEPVEDGGFCHQCGCDNCEAVRAEEEGNDVE